MYEANLSVSVVFCIYSSMEYMRSHFKLFSEKIMEPSISWNIMWFIVKLKANCIFFLSFPGSAGNMNNGSKKCSTVGSHKNSD